VSQLSPQTLYLAVAAVALVLWYKGYLDDILSRFGGAATPGKGDGLDAAVAKAMDDAERAAKRDLVDRMREQIHAGVKASFGAAGQNTQAQTAPANPPPGP
jgi:hypothetical protein